MAGPTQRKKSLRWLDFIGAGEAFSRCQTRSDVLYGLTKLLCVGVSLGLLLPLQGSLAPDHAAHRLEPLELSPEASKPKADCNSYSTEPPGPTLPTFTAVEPEP